jgi:TonB family protein
VDDNLSRYINSADIPITEPDAPELKKKGKGGGGGGGGGEDNAPISKGDLPPQFKEQPLFAPSKDDISADSEIKIIRGTKGPQDIIPDQRSATNGDPNSTNLNPSDGLSPDNLGMGQNGRGGIGNRGENGVGENGKGGIGTAKDGENYGNQPGDGGNPINNRNRIPKEDNPPDFNKNQTVSSIALNITYKPRATYTNEARQAGMQGTVTLRVTFSATGEIGSIVVVSGLSHGLTEQAIAAARSIKFEPAKRNGVAYTVTRNVQYNFVLY